VSTAPRMLKQACQSPAMST